MTATNTTPRTGLLEHTERGPLTTDELAARIARDIPPGSYVNLGIGQPTRIAEHLPPDAGIVLGPVCHRELVVHRKPACQRGHVVYGASMFHAMRTV